MLSIADMLLGRIPEPPPKPKRVRPNLYIPKARNPVKPESASKMRCMQNNADKPCAMPGCGKPRHKSKSGRCHSALCTEHYGAKQARYRAA